jgi:hypothetical protein
MDEDLGLFQIVRYVGDGLAPRGTIGVIVHVYRKDGRKVGYEVEFEGFNHAVFTVPADDVEADVPADGQRIRHQITVDLEVEDDHVAVFDMIENLLAPLGIGFITMRSVTDDGDPG